MSEHASRQKHYPCSEGHCLSKSVQHGILEGHFGLELHRPRKKGRYDSLRSVSERENPTYSTDPRGPPIWKMNPVDAIRSADGLFARPLWVSCSAALPRGQAVVAGKSLAPLKPNSTTDEVSPDE